MELTELQIQESYRDCVPGLDKYIDSKQYTAEQLEVIRYGLENGFDVTSYANPNLSIDEMKRRFFEMLQNK